MTINKITNLKEKNKMIVQIENKEAQALHLANLDIYKLIEGQSGASDKDWDTVMTYDDISGFNTYGLEVEDQNYTYSSEVDAIQSTVNQLKDDLRNLKISLLG